MKKKLSTKKKTEIRGASYRAGIQYTHHFSTKGK